MSRAPAIAGLAAGTLVSLAPGLIPRAAMLQGAATGLCAVIGLALGLLCARWLSKARPAVVWLLSLPLLAGAIWLATAHQNRLRSAAALPGIGLEYWPTALVVAAAVVALCVLTARLLRGLGRRLGTSRTIAAAALVAVLAVVVLPPAAQGWLENRDREVEAAVAQPLSSTRAGGPESLVPWESLGVHGRRFAADVSTPSSVRVYAGLDSAPTPSARADLAARELVRAGGLRRDAVILAVPTGSGWIDDAAATGFESRFGGDVAIVGVQYDRAPSWLGYLLRPDAAAESAQALHDAVAARIAALPPEDRPALYLYGQSLGAVGASAVRGGEELCGVIAVGPPAGATARPDSVVLANATDPVARWSPKLLVGPTGDGTWLPVVSFVQTSVDVLGALDLPAGDGHVYGAEQADALPTCPGADRPEIARTALASHPSPGEPRWQR